MCMLPTCMMINVGLSNNVDSRKSSPTSDHPKIWGQVFAKKCKHNREIYDEWF